MKLLHVIGTLNPHGGGPMEGIRQLAIELHGRGLADVEVATLDDAGSPWLAGFPRPVHPLGPAYLKYRYCPRLVPWLRQHAGNYDAVIVNGIWQYSSFGAWRALRGRGIPYFVFPHGMLDPWFKRNYPLKHLKKWLYWPWADYRVLRDANAVLFTCEEERLLARQSFWLYQCRERVVKYGTKAPEGDPKTQRAAFFARFPELKARRILLFLSRIHEKKGCDLLIRAFGEMAVRPTAGDPWHLVLAGPCSDPGYLEHLRRLSSDLCPPSSTTFPGMLSGDVKWGAFRAADAFVLPSHQENFGIAVAEALACGVPVLISDKVNIWREIKDDGAGFVNEDTLEGTRFLLDTWSRLTDAEKLIIRTSAQTCFHTRFAIKAAADSLFEIIRSSLNLS